MHAEKWVETIGEPGNEATLPLKWLNIKIFNILFTLLQHVQENLKLTGGRKAGEGQPPAVQAVGAPAQAPAAAGLLEEEED